MRRTAQSLCMASMLVITATRAEDAGLPALIATEAVQNAVSAKLTQMAAAQQDRQRPLLDRTIADIERTTHLPEERLRLLRIAGQGALEQAADGNSRSWLAEVESRTKGVAPELVPKVLENVGDSSWSSTKLTEQPGWREAVRLLLTEEERKRYEQVVAEREAYRARAFGELVMMEVRRSTGLSEDQLQRLQPLIESAVRDYLPDVLATFGGGDDGSLYLGYVTVFVLGVPESDAKAIVKPEQWAKWQAAGGRAAGNWSWIKQQHEQRVKKNKP